MSRNNKWSKRLQLTLVTAPTVEPLTLTEAKDHLRVTDTEDDTYITSLITVARKYIEENYAISIINQTWDYYQDNFMDEIELPRAPLSSVTAVTYADTDGATQTLATGVYTVDTDSTPGRIYEAYDQTWPSVQSIPKAIKVRFVGGFSAAATGVPVDIKQAILLMVGHWYENRENVLVGVNASELPLAVDSLLSPYRIIQV
jgi:uncharacterized phiE125 gp8 family phage protein